MMLRTLLALSALLAAQLAVAQQYRWVDENGRVHYTDTPPPPTARDVERKRMKGNAVGAQGSYELAAAMKSSPVTLYSHPDCKDLCQIARDVLNKRGVPFSEVSATDEAKLEELRRVSGSSRVPVLVVGNQVGTTVSAQAYNRALDLAGYPRAGVARPRNQAEPPATEGAAAPR
ncbi:MAG TPA: glutaredoxin family protein [Burkholderiales bacterium]|jgi:glutaredoxin|nr:glutaredoxin family protein [Burkholderiales bacterium]